MNRTPFMLGVSFFSDILPLFFSLIMIVLVLYLCYIFSKYAAKKMTSISQYNNIRIIERVALGQDKGLLIAEICKKYYLIAFANNKVEILKELDPAELNLPQQTDLKQDFLKVLNQTLKGRLEGKQNGRADSPDCEKSRSCDEKGREE